MSVRQMSCRVLLSARARVAPVALLLALVACHSSRGPASPGQAGPQWFEIQSEHFILWTNASASRGRRLIREMEHLRRIVLGVGFGLGASDVRSFVIALRDRKEVGEFLPPSFTSYAWGGDGVLPLPIVLIPADTDGADQYIITNMLAFVIASGATRNQPEWFAAGLGEFFATVRADPDRTTADIGAPLDYIAAHLRMYPPTPAAKVFSCKTDACKDVMFYATAWAFLAYLVHERPAGLLRYVDRVSQSSAESAQQVWSEVFPDLTPTRLDSEIRKWRAYGRHTVWRINVRRQECPVTERTLSDSDVLAARALLRFKTERGQPQVTPELQESLAKDPTNALSHLLLAAIEKKFDIDDARRMAAAHPTQQRGWWLVYYAINGFALKGAGGESVEAREKTFQLMVTGRVDPPRLSCTLRQR